MIRTPKTSTASLSTIAAEVGVDASLVSRVLRNDPSARLSAQKRSLILEVAARTGYRPNRIARSLRMQRTHILAMLTPDITNPFQPWLFRAVEARANLAGYHIILCNTDDNPEQALKVVSALCEGHVDGLLVGMAQEYDPSIDLLRQRNIPYVLVNRRRHNETDPWFGSDAISIGKLGAKHLLDLGHRRIAYFDGNLSLEPIRGRHDGFLAELTARGTSAATDLIRTGLSTRAEAGQAMREVLKLSPELRPTAVFVPRSLLMDGIIDALVGTGLRIPEDLSILGFNVMSDPVVTSIREPVEDIGQSAVDCLINLIEHPHQKETNSHVIFPVGIIDRGTTATPKGLVE